MDAFIYTIDVTLVSVTYYPYSSVPIKPLIYRSGNYDLILAVF